MTGDDAVIGVLRQPPAQLSRSVIEEIFDCRGFRNILLEFPQKWPPKKKNRIPLSTSREAAMSRKCYRLPFLSLGTRVWIVSRGIAVTIGGLGWIWGFH